VKAVADTNVVISGLLWSGNPGRILEAAALGEITLYTSPALVSELAETLGAAKLQKRIDTAGLTVQELLRRYLDVALLTQPSQVEPVVPNDPDDDHVIAAAIAGGVDIIISGDTHLLRLGQHAGIRVLRPAAAAELIDTDHPR
jgi:putative PIN family toxin of toxin-antitoxin system